MSDVSGSNQEFSSDNSKFLRFLHTFNEIESFMRQRTCSDQNVRFPAVLERYQRLRPRLEVLYELGALKDLRNLSVHNLNLSKPICLITDMAIAKIENIRKLVVAPETAEDAYVKPVHTVSPKTPISEILEMVRMYDFSQLPVYDNGVLVGLVTASGMTRWIARHVPNRGSNIELRDHFAQDILASEEERESYKVVPRTTPVDVIEAMFADSAVLEAVIISDTGLKTEPPLGIVTEWDVARLT